MTKSYKNRRSLGTSLAIGALIGISTALIFTTGFFFRDLLGTVVPRVEAASSNFELLQEVQQLQAGINVIVITAFGSIDSAIELIRAGAFDYITKPIDFPVAIARIETQ